jgi:hypothetical protein
MTFSGYAESVFRDVMATRVQKRSSTWSALSFNALAIDAQSDYYSITYHPLAMQYNELFPNSIYSKVEHLMMVSCHEPFSA